MGVTHDIGLGNEAGLFEVTVGDLALGVVKRDKVSLDVRRKGCPPDMQGQGGVEVHSPHARLGCISSTQQSRVLGDKFHKVGWPHAEASHKASEVHDVSTEVLSDPDMVSLSLQESQLESAAQPA